MLLFVVLLLSYSGDSMLSNSAKSFEHLLPGLTPTEGLAYTAKVNKPHLVMHFIPFLAYFWSLACSNNKVV